VILFSSTRYQRPKVFKAKDKYFIVVAGFANPGNSSSFS